ncbi:class I SAM-dependent methyltransferase [Aeromicrobium sp. NPDC092404]|uniref:class I SAM-dependent methyltransferase n=1 Tax=Aeromicrobium sp. NPDC092404 TaxID=3154976 RepID=UPI0034440A9F
MDGGDGWSEVAEGWSELWGRFPEPAWAAVLAVAVPAPGSRVLDVGCGSGELIAHLERQGFAPAGIDPAPGMVALAHDRVPRADVKLGVAEHLPWPTDSFELVTAVNALQLVADTDAALAELVRVTVTGGSVAVVNWAGRDLNDLDTIEAAVADAVGDEPRPEGALRAAGELEQLLTSGGLVSAEGGLVKVPWHADDDDALVRGVLLGEDPETLEELAPTVLAAAKAFRRPDGGYTLVNHLRYGVGRKPARPDNVGRTSKG